VVIYIGVTMSFVITMSRASVVAMELYGTALCVSDPLIRHEFYLVKSRNSLPLVMFSLEFQSTFFKSPAIRTGIPRPRQADRS
jgi:hypothetical protein